MKVQNHGNFIFNFRYSFLGEPAIEFDVNIIIGENFKLDINVFKVKYNNEKIQIKNFFKENFRKKFRKYSLPNKRPLTIPLTIDPASFRVPDNVGNPKNEK